MLKPYKELSNHHYEITKPNHVMKQVHYVKPHTQQVMLKPHCLMTQPH